MRMNNAIVIDASVSMGWILKEKEDIPAIKELVDDLSLGNVIAIAPTIWLYEILNGLRMAVVRHRLDKITAKKKIPDILQTAPGLFEFPPLAENAFQISAKYGLSVYDASYLALAQYKRYNFYTGDQNLYEKVKNKLKFVKSISYYKKFHASQPHPK